MGTGGGQLLPLPWGEKGCVDTSLCEHMLEAVVTVSDPGARRSMDVGEASVLQPSDSIESEGVNGIGGESPYLRYLNKYRLIVQLNIQ